MDVDAEHQAFGIDEQMAFAALHLLAGVVAAHPAHSRRLDRLDAR
jgi:hypothetical protein